MQLLVFSVIPHCVTGMSHLWLCSVITVRMAEVSLTTFFVFPPYQNPYCENQFLPAHFD